MKKICLLLCLSGCMVGPNYAPPENLISNRWASGEEDCVSPPDVLRSWWEVFEDPLLNRYIAKAEECNYDLMTAEAHILRARALRQVSASNLFPQVNADLNGTKTYFSKNGPVFAIGPAANNASVTSSPLTALPFSVQVPQVQNLFNALFDATWELDFFGKTRRSIEVADALIGSAIEERNDLLISLFGEVARTYMELRSFQQRKQIQEEMIAVLEEIHWIKEKQWEAGLVNGIDLEQSQSVLSSAKAELPDTVAEIYRSIYTLSVLTGALPETLVDELLAAQDLPKAPSQIAMGVRSDLLRRRPDVRRAERELAAATASVGVAVASFFPTISLLGMGGFQSLQLPELLSWGSNTWAYGTDVSMPVYQGGKIMGNLHLTQAEQKAAASNYQQVVLSAIQNAESALMAYKQDQIAESSYRETVASNEKIYSLSKERFHLGLVNKNNLLESRKQLLETDLQMLFIHTRLILDSISVYKALGGGWERAP